ncbi:MAG: hypothetical protein ACYC64_01745 [Armatimonadota bacterium]
MIQIRIKIARANKRSDTSLSNTWVNMAGRLASVWDRGNYE